ncbi:MAG TPA: phosphomannomutase/phosphoglucomutase [Nitrospirota bacterium]|nr:phosphomannomutase/phosphoglucomutase [Nitrospirota bacterium]
MNTEIFREYDIRGVADQDLTPPVVQALGRAFASYIKPKGVTTVTIGYDARVSSLRLCDDIVRGLVCGGMNVTVIGLCPTPVLYFSLFHLNPGAGVMITGSHNPAEFNGFKLCVGKDTIFGEEIQKIRRITEKAEGVAQGAEGNNSKTISREPRTVSRYPVLSDYREYLKKQFAHYHEVPLKVVLDAGNGTAGLAAPDIIRAMGCDVIELFSEPDGRFPNHHPDPTIPKNLNTLIDTVRTQKADIGIAFDGDSDRIGVIDEQGNILWGDQLMVIFSRDILAEKPGATFVSEVKCSQTMYDDIRSHGGHAIMWKTGHSLIKAKMKEVHAALAGEMSGHLFFADRYYGYDDAIYAACRFVEILKKIRSRGDRAISASTLISDLPKTYNTPEIRFDCPDHLKFKVVEKAKDVFMRADGLPQKPREVITVDGVRAVFENGWGLVRASNTQPVLVMRFEANDPAALASIKEMMEGRVNSILSDLKYS